jgi:hypothetical protein
MYDPPPTHAPTTAPSIAPSKAETSMKNMNETAMEGDNLTKYGESEHDYLGAPNASGYYSEKNASEISESTESNLTAGGGDEIIGNSTAIEEIDHAKLNDREDEFNTTGIHQHRNLWSSLVNFLYSRRQLAEISDNSMDEISLGITSGTLDEDDDEIPIPEFSTTSGDVLMNSTGTANAEELADDHIGAEKSFEEPSEKDPADAAIEAGEPGISLMQISKLEFHRPRGLTFDIS